MFRWRKLWTRNFYRLLSCQGVSGRETNIQKTAAAYMEGFADEVRREVNGNVTGILNPDSSFKILLAGHIDEIGLMVTDHTEEGFLRAARVGDYPADVSGTEGAD